MFVLISGQSPFTVIGGLKKGKLSTMKKAADVIKDREASYLQFWLFFSLRTLLVLGKVKASRYF